MRVVIQRVQSANVKIADVVVGEIESGILVLLGIEEADTEEDMDWLVRKISRIRIFDDTDGVMNLSLLDTGKQALVVSQFTLHASTKKGNRPSYIKAAKPETAEPMYKKFVKALEKEIGKPVPTGEFGAMMQVSLINDGPVTIIIDSKNKE
ncbi:MAG TPA: D-aminoacyl-tRNA deacylase [Flavobacteriaceae bacterium]|nr:D-aminoacyl-tRNA deacylase [Flavobacteriaceae bacterium]